jgi:hypothetical protein
MLLVAHEEKKTLFKWIKHMVGTLACSIVGRVLNTTRRWINGLFLVIPSGAPINTIKRVELSKNTVKPVKIRAITDGCDGEKIAERADADNGNGILLNR